MKQTYTNIIANEEIRDLAIEVAQKLKLFLDISTSESILSSSDLVKDAFMQHLRYNFYMDCEELRGEMFNPVEDNAQPHRTSILT